MGVKETSKEMEFGSLIDKRIQNDPKFLPTLPRYPLMQYKMSVIYNKIPLVGLPDGIDFTNPRLADYKTGKKKWDQDRADETGQLTMYLLLVYISKKVSPEKFRCFIHWLPTQANGDFTISLIKDCKPITIETKRTMADLLKFGQRINSIYKQMEEYCLNHD